jgi:YggT family protein
MGILATTLSLFLTMLRVLVLARILSSWFRPGQRTSGNGWFFVLDDMVFRATEPLLAPIRNLLPSGGMGLDFAPLILLLLVHLLGGFLVNVLVGMGL